MPPVDQNLKDWLELASFVATAFGFPIVIVGLFLQWRSDRLAREQQIYLAPNSQYLDYLRLCFENPELDIYDLVTPAEESPRNTKREWIAFNILISIMEQAFLLYRRHPYANNRQWQGWKDFIRWWMVRPNFRRAWDEGLANQFDAEFVSFVRSLPPYELEADDFSYDWMTRGVVSTDEAAGTAGVPTSERAAAQQADAADERGMAGDGPARS